MRFGLRKCRGDDPAGTGNGPELDTGAEALRAGLGRRSLVLIGLMGAGKSSIGRRLAKRLDLGYADADSEIEAAAGQSISDMFEQHGEAYFRDGERRVIARMLGDGPQVLATGGGAYMEPRTRAALRENAISVWLRADLDVLVRRVRRRTNRPLLKDRDPRAVMQALIEQRYPIYGEADVTVQSRDVPHEVIVGEIIDAVVASGLLVPRA